MESLVSVIIPTLNEKKNLLMTIDSIRENANYSNVEIIVVDSSDKGSEKLDKNLFNNPKIKIIHSKREGISRARNFGSKHANGGILIFLDSHCKIFDNFIPETVKFLNGNPKTICTPCINVMNDEKTKGYGMTLKGPTMEALWLYDFELEPFKVLAACGCCIAVKKRDFFDIGMFDHDYLMYAAEDIEFSIRAWLSGYSVYVLPHAEISHLFRSEFPYNVNQLEIDKNILRTAILHFKPGRIQTVINEIRKKRNIDGAIKSLHESDIFEKRINLLEKRKYNDDWLFERFEVGF